MSFSAVIIDDEPLAVEALRRFCDRSGRVTVVGEANDGAAGIERVHDLRPDVVFLDIGMPGLSGLDVADRLASAGTRPQIVFVTAFDHYATQAFDLSVTDYILKPIGLPRLERALARIENRLAGTRPNPGPAREFWVPSRGGIARIGADAIQRVDAERDYVRLSTAQNSYLLREPISAIEVRLDAALFVRIHRSTIRRCDTIVELRHLGGGAWAAVDRDGRCDRVGRSYLTRVRERLGCTA